MKNINLALSAVMLLSLVSVANGACEKCASCADAKAKSAAKETLEATREANAAEIKREVFKVDPAFKPCKKKNCENCTKRAAHYPKFKYSEDKKYLGGLVSNADQNYIKVFDLDTKKRVLYLLPSKKMRDLAFKDNSVVIKWAGVWRTETTYSLGEECKKCGKTRHIGRVKKTRALWGYAPCL